METLIPKALEPKRKYLKENFDCSSWETIKEYCEELLERKINSVKEVEQWILDCSELEAACAEDKRWRYIKMSVNSNDKEAAERYNYYVKEIGPKMSAFENELNIKLLDSPYLSLLDQEKYFIYLRRLKQEREIYREENVQLLVDAQMTSQQFGETSSKMTIEHDGEELTIQQAAKLLNSKDRALRKSIYTKIATCRLEYTDQFDQIYSDTIALRHQVALNAGFKNYRDYKFAELKRFDYSPVDCFQFHNSIASEIMPIAEELALARKKALGVETLQPWDLMVDVTGDQPIKPYDGEEDMINKSIECLNATHPYFGQCLTVMREMGRLDLSTRKGKRPGGYNMSLPESGVPFIFMNSADTVKDVRVMMHECGHAVHSFLVNDFPVAGFKKLTAEIAELAAMSMELLTMDHWDVFIKDKKELRRAKLYQLTSLLELTPWIATIDKFQQWVYTNPGHSVAERDTAWLEIYNEFTPTCLDWNGVEHSKMKHWQKQLHLYEFPFYYIEYGFAQLGAIAIWRNYCENPGETVDNYIKALKLGYTRPIGEIFETAGIRFDFSAEYIKSLAEFVKGKIKEYSA